MDTGRILDAIKGYSNRLNELVKGVLVSERDRRAALIGVAVLSLLIIYMAFQSFSSGKTKLEKKAAMLKADLGKIESLRAEYVEAKRRVEESTRNIRTGDEALISVVEKVLVDARVDRSNFSISSRTDASGDLYDEKSVDVDIKKIPLSQAVDLLYKIQTNPNFLKVSKFRMRTRFDNPNLLDASFRLSTFTFKQVSQNEK